MKKILLLLGFLASFALPVVAQDSPLTNFDVYAGNTYFNYPKHGDGTYRWAETRILFGRESEYRLLSGGVFANYTEVGSLVDNFHYYDQEFTVGLSMNAGSQYWLRTREIWTWLNAGIKFMKDHGTITKYNARQNDKFIYASGGFFLKDPIGNGLFSMQKVMLTYAQPIQSDKSATWDAKNLSEYPFDKGFAKVDIYNTMSSTPIRGSLETRFETKIVGSASYMYCNQRLDYSGGIALTWAGKYSQELITLEGGMRYYQSNAGSGFYVSILGNLGQMAKLFTRNNNQQNQ